MFVIVQCTFLLFIFAVSGLLMSLSLLEKVFIKEVAEIAHRIMGVVELSEKHGKARKAQKFSCATRGKQLLHAANSLFYGLSWIISNLVAMVLDCILIYNLIENNQSPCFSLI